MTSITGKHGILVTIEIDSMENAWKIIIGYHLLVIMQRNMDFMKSLLFLLPSICKTIFRYIFLNIIHLIDHFDGSFFL